MKRSGSSKIVRGNELIVKEREKDFYIPPTKGIPKYDAASDPNCPRARVRKYNEDRRAFADMSAEKSNSGAGAKWINKTLKSKFENPPIRLTPSLRAKAMTSLIGGSGTDNAKGSSSSYQSKGGRDLHPQPDEVEILQKIIVRENMLTELHRLLDNQNDVSTCLSEVVEIIKAIRFQTTDLVEDIDHWQIAQPVTRAFLFRGFNYLLKIANDLQFLDRYEEITEKFCFEFKRNPFGYRDGGNIITDVNEVYNSSITNTYNHQHNDINSSKKKGRFYDSSSHVDGVEVIRLINCEKTIQREVVRVAEEKKQFHPTPGAGIDLMVGEAGMSSSVVFNDGNNNGSGMHIMQYHHNQQQQYTHDQHNAYGSSTADAKKVLKVPQNRKWRAKFDPLKVKGERIAVLTEEIGELRAMEAHLEDQVQTHVRDYQQIVEKKKVAEHRRNEALLMRKEVAAQHIAVEISIMIADMQDINTTIKDLQRQGYFISLERRRKRKVVQQLADEVNEEKKRAAIKLKLAQKIKEKGIIGALKTLNKINMEELLNSLDISKDMNSNSVNRVGYSENDILESLDQLSSEKEVASSPTGLSVQQKKARGDLAMQRLSEVLAERSSDDANFDTVPSVTFDEDDEEQEGGVYSGYSDIDGVTSNDIDMNKIYHDIATIAVGTAFSYVKSRNEANNYNENNDTIDE